jgi:hypothetical protein
MSVGFEEEFARNECRALIAVNKGMIASDAERICPGKRGRIAFATGKEILRPRQSRFQKPLVTSALPAAVLCDLTMVNGDN